MTGAAFPDRIVQVTVSVARPNAQAGGAVQTSTYVWQQNRMRVTLRQGGAQFGNARVEVFGVPPLDMNNIARLWLETLTPQITDTIQIAVWNGQSFTPLFQGVIAWSAVDASAMPQVRLVIEANSSFALGLTTASPYANAGPVTLQAALTTIAAAASFTVVYSANATQHQLTDVRLTGSPLDQIIALMHHYPDLTWTTQQQQVIVRPALAPVTQAGTTPSAGSNTGVGANVTPTPIRIAVDTGMQSSPVYSTSGLQIATLFNPQITPGTTLDVETTFDYVNRTIWVANVLEHQLDVNMPNGQWTTYVAANSFGTKGNNNGNTSS